MKNKINFESKFKVANFLSIFLFVGSLILVFIKGLNFGIDFKGGTLIELRAKDQQISTLTLRISLLIVISISILSIPGISNDIE